MILALGFLFGGLSCSQSDLVEKIHEHESSIREDFFSLMTDGSLIEGAFEPLKKKNFIIKNVKPVVERHGEKGAEFEYHPQSFDLVASGMKIIISFDFSVTMYITVKGSAKVSMPIDKIVLKHQLKSEGGEVSGKVTISEFSVDLTKATFDLDVGMMSSILESLVTENRKKIVFQMVKREMEIKILAAYEKNFNNKLKQIFAKTVDGGASDL